MLSSSIAFENFVNALGVARRNQVSSGISCGHQTFTRSLDEPLPADLFINQSPSCRPGCRDPIILYACVAPITLDSALMQQQQQQRQQPERVKLDLR